MVAIQIVYQGQLRCQATHGPSGVVIETDAPKDNMGLGESFSPTDLVATALGTCMLTIMGITARKLGIDIDGSTVQVEKQMVSTPVRRIDALNVHIRIPHAVSEEHQKKLYESALTCPVHKSLHPDIKIPIQFTCE